MRGERHLLVNRNLFLEFAAFLAAADWDTALLQEVPPRWASGLARATRSRAFRSLTSRNWLRPFTFLAARSRPHLVGSWEGGSNLILVRSFGGGRDPESPVEPGLAVDRRRMTLAWRPERRVVSMVRPRTGPCIANLHAGTGRRAEADVLRAAEAVAGWAGEEPLILGGDFNCRPAHTRLYERLESEFGLAGVSGPASIDHILVRGLAADPAEVWPPPRRDVPDPGSGLLIRLADHAPVSRRVQI
ncbi:MAG: hypothetical protein M9938_07920 [Solirubrobacterales bacterium]|nr:hypothetical protein [Solirubrobacterales bacterium]